MPASDYVRGVTTGAGPAPLTVDRPPEALKGDVIAAISNGEFVLISAEGFNRSSAAGTDSGNAATCTFEKVVEENEPAQYTFTGDSNPLSVVIIALKREVVRNAFDVAPDIDNMTVASTTSPTADSIITGGDDSLVLAFFNTVSTSDTGTYTPPSGYDEIVEFNPTGTSYNIYVAGRVDPGAGSTGSKTASKTGSSVSHMTMQYAFLRANIVQNSGRADASGDASGDVRRIAYIEALANADSAAPAGVIAVTPLDAEPLPVSTAGTRADAIQRRPMEAYGRADTDAVMTAPLERIRTLAGTATARARRRKAVLYRNQEFPVIAEAIAHLHTRRRLSASVSFDVTARATLAPPLMAAHAQARATIEPLLVRILLLMDAAAAISAVLPPIELRRTILMLDSIAAADTAFFEREPRIVETTVVARGEGRERRAIYVARMSGTAHAETAARAETIELGPFYHEAAADTAMTGNLESITPMQPERATAEATTTHRLKSIKILSTVIRVIDDGIEDTFIVATTASISPNGTVKTMTNRATADADGDDGADVAVYSRRFTRLRG